VIETAHLRLIPYAPSQLLTLIEHPERFADVFAYPAAVGLRQFFVSGEVSTAWLASLRTLQHPDPWTLGFAVVHRDERQLIGSAGFKGAPDADGVVEIAYGIVPTFGGRGYATEAAHALVAHAFGSGLVQRVRAHTLPTKNASTRVLTKCGFQRIGDVVDPDDGPVWRWERGANLPSTMGALTNA
jgi:RimJ/RimL family protein N-acetyltransferase